MKTKRILSLVLSLCLLLGALSFGTSAAEKELSPTGNYTYYIETYEQLINLAKTAQADCRYILSSDVYQSDNLNDLEVVIPAGATFHLDLNGYKIERVTQGNDCALFRIRSGGVMTVKDTSAAHTGYCSFSEGYADYYKAVFLNEGGELEIFNGYYEIFSPHEQGDCSVVRTTSGYTNIYDGTFDSSASWGGDTISVGHYAYLYDTPYVVIFGGDFYGKYSNIDISPYGNYLNYGKEYPNGSLHPCVYVLGGNFYITNGGKDGEDASFAYCNNGWGRVFVAQGTVLSKCLNSHDQRFLEGTSKEYFTQTIDDYKSGYYKVTAPPMIISESLDYHYRLINLCRKAEVDSYDPNVYEIFKEQFDEIEQHIDTIYVGETVKTPPEIKLENRTKDHQYINWYMCDESQYNGSETQWTHLGNIQDVSQWTPDERPEYGANYILRCVATNSDLTTYEDIVRITYAPLKKSETVDTVEIKDVTTPASGANPDFDVTPGDDSFYINGVYWTDVTDSKNKVILKETDTFLEGHTYELEVWIRANEFYQFKTDSDGWLEISALIGGKESEVILPGSYISAELILTYTIDENITPTNTTSTDPFESTSTTHTETAPTQTVPTISNPSESKGTDPTQTKPDPTESKSTTPTEANPTESVPSKVIGILGDADENSKVNVKDATSIQKHIASLIALTETGVKLADADGNQNVNVKDATAIQKHIAGMNTGYPIGTEVTK